MITARLFSLSRSLVVLLHVAPAALLGCLPTEINGGTTCSYEGEDYEAGDSFPSADGCNSCSCMEDGGIACTLMACGGEGGGSGGVAVCSYEGVVYHAGDSFPAADGCNSCGCMDDGSIACTAIGCGEEPPPCGGEPSVCVYEDVVYHAGDSFPAADGCNTCGCMDDGSIACTEIGCSDAP
jgi:hypothetical protein